MRKYIYCLGFVFASVITFMCKAEQKQVLGPWDVHYIVVNTTFLTPEIARQNGITRSKYNALVNISVLDSDSQQAQLVAIKGSATNLLGNRRELKFKRVQEGQAIYYLAVIPFSDRETYKFNVQLSKGTTQQQLNFQQTMSAD